MSSDYDSDSSSEMDLLEMAECILRDFLIYGSSDCDDIVSDELDASSSDCDDIVSDEWDEYISENEMTTNRKPDNEHNNTTDHVLWESNNAAFGALTSTEDITGSNVTLSSGERKCKETDDASGNKQAIGPDPVGDCASMTEGILQLIDCVRATYNDLQQCFTDLNRVPSDVQHLLDTGKKMGYLDTSDLQHSQQDFSASEEEPTHPDIRDVDIRDVINALIEFREKDRNRRKEYREQVLCDLSDSIIPIAKSVLRLCIEQSKCTNSSNRQDSDLEGMDNKAEHSELNFGVIAMALLELFRSKKETENESAENMVETAGKEKTCAGSTGTDKSGWITWIDGIYELVKYYCEIKASNVDSTENNERRKNTKWARTAHRDRNTDCKKDKSKHPVTIWPEIFNNVITDLVKLCLWIYGGCQEVTADSAYKADDVVAFCDGSFTIDDLLSQLRKFQYCSLEFSDPWGQLALPILPIMMIFISKVFNCLALLLHLFFPEPVSENMLPFDLFQFLNWINDNSSYITNIECIDTDTILTNIGNCLSNMLKKMDLEPLLKVLLTTIAKFLPIMFFPLMLYHGYQYTITGLKYIGKIFPYLEDFLRNILRINLSYVLCFFSINTSFTEKICMFGRQLVKKVSIIELLCYSRQGKQSTPLKITEMLEIVKKLNDDFQTENISSRLKPELFHYEQHEDSVLRQPAIIIADVECKSVLDLLLLRYQDTLSQSNWCNACTDVSNLIGMLIDDLRQFAFPEIDELPDFLQYFKCLLTPVLSGSRLDGCVSLLFGPGNASDFDVMGVMYKSNSFIMGCVPDRPTSVVFNAVVPDIYNEFLTSGKEYLSVLHIKNYVALEPIIAMIMSLMLLFRRNFAYSIQVGDVASTFLLFEGKDVILSVDYVQAVSIDSWPDQAKNWIHRNYDWPVFEVRESISRGGCHAVAKTPKGGDPDKEWRLSFSKAENTLCKVLTPSQAFHLSLLKTQFQGLKSKIGSYKVRVFKNYTITKGEFHTYHAKTAMFWFCESHPPAHDIWKKENVFRCQSELLESMEGMMRVGHIPHYFIPEQNLLEDIPVELLQQAASELSVLKEEARTGDGRVYQEIIKQPPHEDQFLGILNEIESFFRM